MNQHTKHGELAARIRAAYAGAPIAPIRSQLADLDVDAAYAIQQENTANWEAEGRRLVGSKIGLTSRAVQKQLGVDRPDFGVLFADMHVAEDEPVVAGRVLQPKIEAEVAFLLDRDVDVETPTVADVLARRRLCDARARDRRQPDHELGHRHRRYGRRQRLVGTVRAGRSRPPPGRLGSPRDADADDAAERGRIEGHGRRLSRQSAQCDGLAGWRTGAPPAARYAPARSCCRERSVPMVPSMPGDAFEAIDRRLGTGLGGVRLGA